VSNGNLEALKEAVGAFGLTLKETDKTLSTLLHHASSANQLLVMQYLIDNGAELDAADKDGNTPLHVAASKGNAEAVHLLLDSGVNTTTFNNGGDAPLHTAGKEKSGQALGAFLAHSRVDWGLKGFRNRTVMHVIAEADNLECCKVLHEKVVKKVGDGPRKPCSPHTQHNRHVCACSKDDDGLTAIHLAARMNSHRVLEYIIQQCKNHHPNFVLESVDEENGTPLHAAVDSGNFEVACVMLKYGANPLALKGDIPPPLHLAAPKAEWRW
jgi:ankyrin repeat protein